VGYPHRADFFVDPARPLRYAKGMQITSAGNEKIKHARRVREGQVADQIFIEGLRLAEEALRSGLTIEVCFADEQNQDPRSLDLRQALTQKQVPIMLTTAAVIRTLSDTVQSQGIILLARRPVRDAAGLLHTPGSLLLALDRLQDPGNLGTLMRTAEAAGVSGLITLPGCADPFSPKVLRSSMGSAFRLPLLTEATAQDLNDLRQNHGFQIVAAAGEGETDYCYYDWRQKTLLLLGNEGRGVSPELMRQCDVRLRIPMHAGVESLNVAAAGAVMLFEAARQRR